MGIGFYKMKLKRPRPNKSPINFDEITRFNEEEIELIWNSFGFLIKHHREEMAVEIMKAVGQNVKGSVEAFEKNRFALRDRWAELGLGLILLSGLERFILRLERPDKMQEMTKRLVEMHENLEISPKMLVEVILSGEETIIESYIDKTDCTTDKVKAKQAWHRFFRMVIFLFDQYNN